MGPGFYSLLFLVQKQDSSMGDWGAHLNHLEVSIVWSHGIDKIRVAHLALGHVTRYLHNKLMLLAWNNILVGDEVHNSAKRD